jgi:hypothetical protein
MSRRARSLRVLLGVRSCCDYASLMEGIKREEGRLGVQGRWKRSKSRVGRGGGHGEGG